jgi:hypothetical protein
MFFHLIHDLFSKEARGRLGSLHRASASRGMLAHLPADVMLFGDEIYTYRAALVLNLGH